MLILKKANSKQDVVLSFYVVDMHHHMGKEENIKNLQPTAPDGSYYFDRAVLFGNQWKKGVQKKLIGARKLGKLIWDITR